MRFIIRILANSLAIYLAAYFVEGIKFEGGLKTLLLAGLILGLVNFFIKPILKTVSMPLIVLSLGLFTIVINMILLWVVTFFVSDLTISGIWAYFWGTIIISIINLVVSPMLKKRKKQDINV